MALDILTNYVEATVTSGGTTAPAAGNSETWTVTTNENWPVLSASQQSVTTVRPIHRSPYVFYRCL